MDPKNKWYEELETRFGNLMHKFDMPEDMEHEIRGFVFAIAQEQYKTGNRNGISWLRKQIGNPQTPVAVAVA